MTDKSSEKYAQGINQYKEWLEAKEPSLKHWRAWGSWFSWGSPVGLGLFFIAVAITIWVIAQAV